MAELFTPEQVRASEVARFVAQRRAAGVADADTRAALLTSTDASNPCLDLNGKNVCTEAMVDAAFSRAFSRAPRASGISSLLLAGGIALAALILWRMP